MKTFLTILISGVFSMAAFSQTIRYEKTFNEAMAKASAQKKLVFLVITPPTPPGRSFTSGLDLPDVVAKYNKNFISYQVSIIDSASVSLRRKFPSNIYPAYFFVDTAGLPVYRANKNSSLTNRYISMADSALKLAKSGKTLGDYHRRFAKGKVDAKFLKEYITLRESFGIYDNAKLIEDYVGYLPISALDNYQDVLFIFKAGPIAYGRAYTLAYINRKVADSIYKTEPAADRSAMNGRIIANTYKMAVEKKDLVLIQQLSRFEVNIYRADYRGGQKESTRVMLSYYQAVKDTSNYLRQASYYFDSYYMNISADSAKRLIEKQRAAVLKSLNKGRIILSDSAKKAVQVKTSYKPIEVFSTISSTSDVATILNNAAYSVYSTGTRNLTYINKAMMWSRRSIDLRPSASFYDTLAHLLYRYGFYTEAEADQNTAIEMATQKNNEHEAEHLKAELIKIRERTL